MTHTGAYQEMLNSYEKITCFRLWYELDLSWYAYRMNLTSSSMREGRIWNVPDFHMNLTSPDTGMRPVRIWSLFSWYASCKNLISLSDSGMNLTSSGMRFVWIWAFQTLVWIWPLLVYVSYEFDSSWYTRGWNIPDSHPWYEFYLSWHASHINLTSTGMREGGVSGWDHEYQPLAYQEMSKYPVYTSRCQIKTRMLGVLDSRTNLIAPGMRFVWIRWRSGESQNSSDVYKNPCSICLCL